MRSRNFFLSAELPSYHINHSHGRTCIGSMKGDRRRSLVNGRASSRVSPSTMVGFVISKNKHWRQLTDAVEKCGFCLALRSSD
jgi:hypothetical protein